MRQIRLSTAELADFNSKTELNAAFIWHYFKQPHNRQIELRFFLGYVTLILKSNSKNALNATYIWHHFIQPLD